MTACTACGLEKAPSEFYAHSGNVCKACRRDQIKAWKRRNRPRVNAQQRRYYERYPERHRAWGRAEARRNWSTERGRRYREQHPDEVRARRAVLAALRSGRLAKPGACSRCGRGGRVEAHHADYSRPLDVEWLCGWCHKAETRRESTA